MLDLDKIQPQLEYHIKREKDFFEIKKKNILWDEQLSQGTSWFWKLKPRNSVCLKVLQNQVLDLKPWSSHVATENKNHF